MLLVALFVPNLAYADNDDEYNIYTKGNVVYYNGDFLLKWDPTGVTISEDLPYDPDGKYIIKDADTAKLLTV